MTAVKTQPLDLKEAAQNLYHVHIQHTYETEIL